MPRKDPEKRRAYAREWYARPENRQRTIAKVTERKHTLYAGECKNCGRPTVGNSKGTASQWCANCRQQQWMEKLHGPRDRRGSTPRTPPSARGPSNSPSPANGRPQAPPGGGRT